MITQYFGKIPFAHALTLEAEAFTRVQKKSDAEVLGFETGPVITLGVRGGDHDLEWSTEEISARGFEVHRLERGGQATLHNPGQLVIFPIFDVRGIGARAWVDLLLEVTRLTIGDFGTQARCRAGAPGLYTEQGKIAAIGIRLRQGISTHGVAINVANDLTDFNGIRPCGVKSAPVDRLGANIPLEDVFAAWLRNFTQRLTTAQNLTNLECSSRDVRL